MKFSVKDFFSKYEHSFLQPRSHFLKKPLKSDSHLPKKMFFICFNDSPTKLMKNAFNFIVKTLFVLKIYKFLS